MGWALKCGECSKWYLETEHRPKDLCFNCRFDIPIKRKVIEERNWILKRENIATKSNETN